MQVSSSLSHFSSDIPFPGHIFALVCSFTSISSFLTSPVFYRMKVIFPHCSPSFPSFSFPLLVLFLLSSPVRFSFVHLHQPLLSSLPPLLLGETEKKSITNRDSADMPCKIQSALFITNRPYLQLIDHIYN